MSIRRFWVCAANFTLLLLTTTAAAAAPFRIADFALLDAASVTQDTRFDCQAKQQAEFALTCSLRRTSKVALDGVPLLSLALHINAERVVAIEALIPEPKKDELLTALQSRYGAPKMETERLRAGMGLTFDNAIYLWRDGDTVLRLEQFFRNINHASLILTSESLLGVLVRPKITDPKTGIKDL